MTKANPSVLAWRAAAATALSAMLAEALGLSPDRLKVQLRTHKTTAAISWQTRWDGVTEVSLYLPKMDLTRILTRNQADTLAGYWLHEAGHVLFTPADGMARNAHMGTGFCRLLNALEDVRMEGLVILDTRRTNARPVLEAITRHVALESTSLDDPVGDANDWRNIGWTLAYLGRAHCHGYALGQHLADYAATLRPGNRALITTALDRLAKASTFADIEALAQWIWADVYPAWDHGQQGQQQAPQEGQQGQGEPGEGQGQGEPGEGAQQASEGQGEPGEGEGQGEPGEGEGQGEPGEGEGQGEPGEGQGEPGEGEGQGEGSGGKGRAPATDAPGTGEGQGTGAGGAAAAPSRDDIRDAEPSVDDIAEDINGTTDEATLDTQYEPWSGLLAAGSAKVTRASRARGSAAELRFYRDKFQGVFAMRAQVRRLFEAPEHYAHNHHEEMGQFDPQAIMRATWGARDVFMTADEAPGHNTAIQVLIDGSSSMKGKNIAAAVGMATHIAELAAAKSCPCQIDVFKTGGGILSTQLGMHRIAAWGERISDDVRERLVGTLNDASGNTPLAASIIHGGLCLDTRDEPRRLLVVLTDGEDNFGPSAVAGAVAIVRKRGYAIAALGLGITGADQITFAEAFNGADAAACSDTHHLATEALRTIADALAKHDWARAA